MTRLDWNEKRLAQRSLPGDARFSDVDVVYKNRIFTVTVAGKGQELFVDERADTAVQENTYHFPNVSGRKKKQ